MAEGGFPREWRPDGRIAELCLSVLDRRLLANRAVRRPLVRRLAHRHYRLGSARCDGRRVVLHAVSAAGVVAAYHKLHVAGVDDQFVT